MSSSKSFFDREIGVFREMSVDDGWVNEEPLKQLSVTWSEFENRSWVPGSQSL